MKSRAVTRKFAVLLSLGIVIFTMFGCRPTCPDHLNSPDGSIPSGARACSPDGKYYARESEPAKQGQIGIFDQTTDELLLTIKVDEQNNDLKGIAWSGLPDSRWLAFMFHHGSGGYVAIADAQTGEIVQNIPIDAWYHSLQFSSDGHLLVSGTQLAGWPAMTPTPSPTDLEPTSTPAPVLASASPTPVPVSLPFLGINYPWYGYGHDFGGAWGHDGVSAETSRAAIESDFADMKRQGVQVVRWFLWADGRASPEFDADGYVTGFDEHFYDDLDAALTVAEKFDIDLMLVLFDFYWFESSKMVDDVQIYGHAETIIDPSKRQSLLTNAVQPLLERYGDHPRIIWDVINEPEGAMTVAEGNWVGEAIPVEMMQEFVGQVVDLIHSEATQPVTLGSASRGALKYWKEVNLNFYQFHYYDHMQTLFPLDVPFNDLGLDKPAIVGEFPTKDSQYSVAKYLDMIWKNGYAGAFPWSYRAGDAVSQFDGAAYCEWAKSHIAGQDRLTCPTPTPTPTPEVTTILCPDHVDSPHGSVPFGDRACSPDGKYYAQEVEPAKQGQIGIFDQVTDELLLIITADEQNNDLKGIAWSGLPDSRWLAFMFHHGSGGYVAIADAQTGEIVQSISIDKWYHHLRFSPDGKQLLASVGSEEADQLEVWPAVTSTLIPTTSATPAQ